MHPFVTGATKHGSWRQVVEVLKSWLASLIVILFRRTAHASNLRERHKFTFTCVRALFAVLALLFLGETLISFPNTCATLRCQSRGVITRFLFANNGLGVYTTK